MSPGLKERLGRWIGVKPCTAWCSGQGEYQIPFFEQSFSSPLRGARSPPFSRRGSYPLSVQFDHSGPQAGESNGSLSERKELKAWAFQSVGNRRHEETNVGPTTN